MVINPWVGSVGLFCIQQQNEGCYGAGTHRFGPQPEVKYRAEGGNECSGNLCPSRKGPICTGMQPGIQDVHHQCWLKNQEHPRCVALPFVVHLPLDISRCFLVLFSPLIPTTNLKQMTLTHFIPILYILGCIFHKRDQ